MKYRNLWCIRIQTGMPTAYSGSALLKDRTMYVYYTGNVRHDDQEYDYVTGGREQNTILITSKDGFHFQRNGF